MSYAYHLIVSFSIAAMMALSINLILGYCGRVTLAHAAYLAIGAYTYALTTLVWGWGFLPAAGLAVIMSSAASLFLSLPARRFGPDQFLLMSLVVQVTIFSLARNWVSADALWGSWANLTNGPYGISGIPRPHVLGVTFAADWSRCALGLGMLALSATICWVVLSAPLGRLLKGIRDDAEAARSLGKNIDAARARVFAVGCGMAGAAGAMYASHVTYVDPSLASLDESVLVLCTIVIGGSGNRLAGPLVGALVLLMVPEILRLFAVSSVDASSLRLLVFGALLMLMIHVRPQGLAGIYRIE